MSSWLKAAEDLFEVVDRRAKLVVNDLSDEQSDFRPGSNGQVNQAKKTPSKERNLPSSNEPPKTNDSAIEKSNTVTSLLEATDDIRPSLSPENDDINSSHSNADQSSDEPQRIHEKDASRVDISSTVALLNDASDHDSNHTEVPITDTDVQAVTSTSNGDLATESASAVPKAPSTPETSPPGPSRSGVVGTSGNLPDDTSHNNDFGDSDAPSNNDQKQNQSESVPVPSNGNIQVKDADLKVEPFNDQKVQEDQKSDKSPAKVQEQLDEAQGLLKNSISTGKSKEARLARVCAGLSARVQAYKSENAQLDELLSAERDLSKSFEERIRQLQQEISASKVELSRAESNMAEALAAKNSEIEALVQSMDALKKQAALSEGNMASLQANMESIMRNRELTETRMMQALREELASAERRAEEERAAHSATKMAAMERQVDLERRAVEASTALARTQRIADERTAKTAELEQKVALLEVECASLNQELQDMEARARRGQKKSPEEANQVVQMQAWQEEVERARQGQRDAEVKLSSSEVEVQKLRVELAAMKRDAEHYSRQEHMELEKRYRELTDLLYYKQTQLEAMASEKAASEFQLEKELKRLQEAQIEAERTKVSRRGSSSWEEDTDIKALEPLPLHHRHMAGASIQLQKAAKLLDSGAVRATRFLWRYPIARIILLFYLVFVHLFLMYLLHRLQEQADSFSSREVAESMGLANPTLP